MTDTSTLWDEAARDAHIEAVKHHKVVALRSDFSYPAPLTPAQRKTIARQSLERAVMQLEILGDDVADEDFAAAVSAVIRKLTHRTLGYAMHLGLVSLAGKTGRAP
jgi:hypothetical protein